MKPFITSYINVMKDYVVYEGRLARREYWQFFAIAFAITFLVSFITGLIGLGIVGTIVALAHLVPNVCASIRRLHDIGKPGWYVLIGLIPIVGLYLLYLLAQPSQK